MAAPAASVPPPRIQAVGFIGPRNNPLWVGTSSASLETQEAPSSLPSADLLRIQHILHSALDIVDERTAQPSSSVARQPNAAAAAAAAQSQQPPLAGQNYLGLLLNLEDLCVYGWQTSTRTRILLALGANHAGMAGREGVVKDLDVITLFRALQTVYLSYVSNPFHALDFTPTYAGQDDVQPATLPDELALPLNRRPIRSAKFETNVRAALGWA